MNNVKLDLIAKYGNDFLMEFNPSSALYEMAELETMKFSFKDLIERVTYGFSYPVEEHHFEITNEYYTYNEFGHLISVSKEFRNYYLLDMILRYNNHFTKWLKKMGYKA